MNKEDLLNNFLDMDAFEQSVLDSLESVEPSVAISEYGVVHSISDGVANIKGLLNAFLDEVILFGDSDDGPIGIVRELCEFSVKVVLVSRFDEVMEGMVVKRTGKDFQIKVGPELVGRVIDVFGNSIDKLPPINIENPELLSIESPAPSMIDRQPVREPLSTGAVVIDAMVPIGRGQRQLVLGDRHTGKTTIAVNAIINQMSQYAAGNPTYCVYVAIGQKLDNVIAVHNRLIETGAMKYTTIVVAGASDSASCQFLAPYVGCAVAEYFLRKGKHAFIVYDDLSKHAVAYREISRLLGRPAGRDAFPADSFYIHARLLERAACMKSGGSITAMPIIETQGGDISSFVATNVISITDGQLFLDQKEFYAQQRPAIDIGESVSRIGNSAQTNAIKKVSRSMKVELAQYAELAKFIKFTGGTIDKFQEKILNKGRQTKYLISQDENELYSLEEQALLISATHYGLFSKIKENDTKKIKALKERLIEAISDQHPKVINEIRTTRDITDDHLAIIKKVTEDIVRSQNE